VRRETRDRGQGRGGPGGSDEALESDNALGSDNVPESGRNGGREADGAVFAAERVARRHDRTPILVAAILLTIGGLVVAGFDREGSGGPGGLAAVASPPASVRAPGPGGGPNPTVAPAGTWVPNSPDVSPDSAPILTSPPGAITLKARRHPETMFVHGDVFVERVTWVFVSLHDEASRVVGWASVSVPGAAGPGVEGGPTLRFDVELLLPEYALGEILWIQANAYDVGGGMIASTRLEAPPDGSGQPAPEGAVEQGFRPAADLPLLDAISGDGS
jgi:hypothetical protein